MNFLFLFTFLLTTAECTKFCINCKYFISNKALLDKPTYGKCLVYPKRDEITETFLITGQKEAQNYHFCSTARMSFNMCGQQGKNFKEKN